jgi:hypothetical protein
MRRAGLSLLLVGAALLLPERAHATDPPPHKADPTNVKEATVLFNEGVKLEKKGDYEHARARFLAASALIASQANLYNLGYCEVRTGRYVEGVNHLRAYLRGSQVSDDDRKDLTLNVLPDAEKHVGDLRIEAPEGASILVDTKDSGIAPLVDPIAVSPGKHHIEARLAGMNAADVDVDAGQTVSISLQSHANVIPASSEPLPERAPPPVVAASPDSGTEHEEQPNQLRLWLTVGLGVAAAGVLAGGLYADQKSLSDKHALEGLTQGMPASSCTGSAGPSCATIRDDAQSQTSSHTIALFMYGGAGLLAAGAAVSWFVLPKTERKAGSSSMGTPAPLVGAGVLGAQWVGRF